MAIFTAIGAAVGMVATFIGALGTVGTFLLQTAVGVGLNLLAKAIAGKPQKPGFSVEGKLRAGGDLSRSLLLGLNCTAGSLVYANTWGHAGGTPNAYLTRVIALADYPIAGLVEVLVNGEPATQAAEAHPSYGFPVLEYRRGGTDYLWIKFYDGTQTTADPFLTGTVSSAARPYSSTRVGRGVPYVIVTARVHEELFGSGFPEHKFVLNGARLYDPSRDDTVGGVGDQRWNDPATWGGDGDHLPAVQLYNLLRGFTYNGEWFYGLQNVAAARLPVADWIAQIEKCRAPVAGPNGNEPAYRTGGEIPVGSRLADAIEAILTGCQGRLAEVGGTYTVRVGAPGAAEFAFTDDDILSTEEQSFTPFYGLADTITGITAKYPSPEEAWNTAVAPPLYRSDLEALAGNRRLLADVSLGLVPYKGQVQRLMKSALAEGQRARRHTLTLPPQFWAYAVPGAICAWTSARNGYVTKLFRIDGAVDRANLDIVVDITEVDPTDYNWDQATDYTPPVIAPVGPIRPAPQPVTGWQVSPATIESGLKRRPSIEVSFDGDLEDVQALRVQARFPDTLEVVFDGEVPYGDPAPGQRAIILNGTFLGGTDYEVRGRFVPFSSRPTEWSAWLPVTTPDIGIGPGELDAALNARIDQAVTQVAGLYEQFREEMDLLGSIVNGQITRSIERDGIIWQGVGARFGEALAKAELGLAAAATNESALASMFGTVFAAVGDNQAESLFRLVAAAAPTDAVASFAIEVRATLETEFAFSGFYVDVGTFEGGKTSRIRLVADSVWIETPGGSRRNALLFSQNNESREAPININGEVRANLSDLELNHHTVLTEDVQVRAPVGLVAGARYSHAFVQESGGGKTVSFDADEFALPHPTIDGLGGVTTYVDTYVRTVNPMRLTAVYSGYSVDQPILFFRDNNSQYEPGGATTDPVFDVGDLDFEVGDLLIALCVSNRYKIVSTSPAGSEWPLHDRTPDGWSPISVARNTRGSGARVDYTGIISAYWKISAGNETAFDPFIFGAPINNPGSGSGGGWATFLSYKVRGKPARLGASPKSALIFSGSSTQTIEASGGAAPLLAVSFAISDQTFSVTPDLSISSLGMYTKIKQYDPGGSPVDVDTSVTLGAGGDSAALLSFYVNLE